MLATCLSGSQYPGITVSGGVNADQSTNPAGLPLYQDIHIPAAGDAAVTFTGSGSVSVRNLLTGAVMQVNSPATATLVPGFYRVLSLSQSQTFSYLARYGEFSYNYYDDARRLVASIAPRGTLPNNLLVNPGFEQDPAYTSTITGWRSGGANPGSSYTEAQGGPHTGQYYGCQWNAVSSVYTYQVVPNLPNGLYTLRAWTRSTGGQQSTTMLAQNYGGAKQEVAIPPSASYQYGPWILVEITGITVTNGQCEVGFQSTGAANKWLYFDDVEFVRQADNLPPQFVTRNAYSGAGTLLGTESRDEGRTDYVYARDGRIRFSQSAQQRLDGKFSYSNYDGVGRVVESGEYTMATDRSQSTIFEPQLPYAVTYEAEEASTITAASTAQNVPDFSGTGYVENMTTNGSSGLTFTVNVPVAGVYSVDGRYSSGSSSAEYRTMQVLVNGAAVGTAAFPGTGSWSTWRTQSTRLTLQAGQNTIRYFYGNGATGWINLDYIQVKPATYEAEEAGTTGVTVDTDWAGYSGTGFIGSITSQNNSTVTFNVVAPAPGSAVLDIRYAAAGLEARTMTLTVNGNTRQIRLPGTRTWDTWAVQTEPIELVGGNNDIRFFYGPSDNGHINLDYVQVRPQLANSVLTLLEERLPASGLEAGRCAQRNQVWYDMPVADVPLGRTQEFVLGAVAKTSNGTATTWYSYDELGRVTWLVQQLPGVGTKTVDYAYDFNGNVLEVAYQKGQADAFYHHYQYDADQRLSAVFTSPDGTTKTLQAHYDYYLHGPLKRTELAGNLQGIDYAYTVQGWLKSINSATRGLDSGQDAPKANGTYKDLFGLTLDYFAGDYTSKQFKPVSPTVAGIATRYDGLVRSASWSTPNSPDVRMNAFTYDGKSQLLQSDFGQLTGTAFTPAANRANEEGALQYDVNGNLLRLRRRDQNGTPTDDFSYQYTPYTNRLAKVNNPSDQAVLDYDYDATGQMTRQRDEQGQRYFRYDVTGKVTGVYRDAGQRQPVALFAYDDRGFRVSKASYNAAGQLTKTTYSVRDAAGNELSTYEQEAGKTLVRSEVPLYGAGRVGTLTRVDDAGTLDARYELNDQLGNARVVFHRPQTTAYTATMEPGQQTNDDQQFRNLSDPRQHDDNAYSGQYVTYLSGSGVAGPAKTLTVEKGDTVTFSAYVRCFAAGTLKPATAFPVTIGLLGGALATPGPPEWRTVDGQPIVSQRSRAINRLGIGISISGLLSRRRELTTNATMASTTAYLHYRLYNANGELKASGDQELSATAWQRVQLGFRVPEGGRLELSSDAQNGPVEFDDVRYEQTGSLIVQEQHQYAFGAPLPGLSYTVGTKRYRHGYQGQYAEKDEETGFDSFELRMYNSRIGRWMATDPEGQFDSPYVGMSNNPVSDVDPDGGFTGGPGKGLLKLKNMNSGYMAVAGDATRVSTISKAIGTASAGARSLIHRDQLRATPASSTFIYEWSQGSWFSAVVNYDAVNMVYLAPQLFKSNLVNFNGTEARRGDAGLAILNILSMAAPYAAELVEARTAKNLVSAGEIIDPFDKGGKFTRAGRAFDKHGKPGTPYGTATGTTAAKNARGKAILEAIVRDPQSEISRRYHATKGPIIEYRSPTHGGARWTNKGKTFDGFL